MLLNCGVGEDSWVPWTARRSNQSILKEISPGCSLEGMMLKLKLQYFGHLMWRVGSLEKTVMLGGIGGRRRRGRQRMRWLDGIPDSMDMSLSELRSWWWTGRPGMLRFMGSQRVGHDWVTELNWCCCKWHYLFLFYSWVIFHCIHVFLMYLWEEVSSRSFYATILMRAPSDIFQLPYYLLSLHSLLSSKFNGRFISWFTHICTLLQYQVCIS